MLSLHLWQRRFLCLERGHSSLDLQVYVSADVTVAMSNHQLKAHRGVRVGHAQPPTRLLMLPHVICRHNFLMMMTTRTVMWQWG